MWIGVTERFRRLDRRLLATQEQVDDARTKVGGILRALNTTYYGSPSEDHGHIVGSWGKRTQIVHTEDVDLLFVVPFATYQRFEQYQSNGQSALLQEVKGVVEGRYPNTAMRGDGQVVVVAFNSLTVEVIPAVALQGGDYWIPNTHSGGSWRKTDPVAQVGALNTADLNSANNTRPLIRLIKAWKYAKAVPLKSFQVELLVTEFMAGYEFRTADYYWYDWFLRDFFRFLAGRANGYVWVPGTYEMIALGDAWLPAAQRAYSAAYAACEYERDDFVSSAGDEWQKVFGPVIDRTV
jgi:hypothetical protein